MIELDGGGHADRQDYDAQRTRVLEGEGFKVIRFWNREVYTNLEGVLDTIFLPPHPSLREDLSHEGRGEGGALFSYLSPRGRGRPEGAGEGARGAYRLSHRSRILAKKPSERGLEWDFSSRPWNSSRSSFCRLLRFTGVSTWI